MGMLQAEVHQLLSVRDESIPRPGFTPQAVEVEEGGDVALSCATRRGSEPVSYSWLRGNATVGLRETGVTTEVWTLRSVQRELHGELIACEVLNAVGNRRWKARSDIVMLTVTDATLPN
ncbi:unnamed protein product [Lampetra fluviatilis]